VSSCSFSVITRKYDVTAISSHARRNVKTFPAEGTTLIPSRNPLNITPNARIDRRPSYASV
jgi:hypothetical protein